MLVGRGRTRGGLVRIYAEHCKGRGGVINGVFNVYYVYKRSQTRIYIS